MATRVKPRLTCVLGGTHAGKSAYALELGNGMAAPRHFVATAEAFDDDMSRRISAQQARRGTGWLTHEAAADLIGTLVRIPDGETLLIDCLTFWLTRTILENAKPPGEAIDELIAVLTRRKGQRIVIATEVGLGIVPDNALARAFRDYAGNMNQRVGAIADSVVLVVAGLPVKIK